MILKYICVQHAFTLEDTHVMSNYLHVRLYWPDVNEKNPFTTDT